MEKNILPVDSVPYYAQVEDVDRITAYLSGSRSLEDDPFWANSGADSTKEYAFWANRACGMVCVKTCVEAFSGPILSLHTWIKRGLAEDAYLTEKRKNNITIEKGWLHTGLAKVMADEGLETRVKASSIEDLVADLREGKLIIASVSYEIGTYQPITERGGHLVTVTSAVLEDGVAKELLIHNPSGRSPRLRENAVISVDRFSQAFSGRVITVGKPKREGNAKTA
jgi:hypothetical protein